RVGNRVTLGEHRPRDCRYRCRNSVDSLRRRITGGLRGLAVVSPVGHERQTGHVPIENRIIPMRELLVHIQPQELLRRDSEAAQCLRDVNADKALGHEQEARCGLYSAPLVEGHLADGKHPRGPLHFIEYRSDINFRAGGRLKELALLPAYERSTGTPGNVTYSILREPE